MSPHLLRANSLLLSDDDRVEIARGAATLFECLARAGAAPTTTHEEGRTVLDAWAHAFAPGDARAFERRLAWDGLDAAGVLRALTAPDAGPTPPPAWTEWLDRFLDAAAAFAAQLGSAAADDELARLAPSPEPPFLEIWVALVRSARRAIADGVESLGDVHPAAWATFERRLIVDFSAAGEMALYDLFRRFDGEPSAGARYPAFVRGLLEGGLAAVFLTYPVLARHLALLASTWVVSTGELLSRLRGDRDAIAAAFGGGALGALRDATPGLSDRHDGGRAVTALTFASGLRVVYKPRDMRLEHAFQRFQAGLADRGLRALPRPVRVVEGEGYGWAERIEQEPFDDRQQVAGYFRRAGTALAILHVLRGDDAHQENVVATRGGPVLVDAEMLLQPMTRGEAEDARADGVIDGAAHGVPRSCLSPGFVTLLDIDADGNTYDVGGLMPASPRATAGGARAWRALRSDDLHFVRERTVRPALRNDVVLDGVVQRPEAFAAEILSGFEAAYRFFLAERPHLLDPAGPLALFADARSRILFRPSDQYGFFLHALFAPRYQRRGLDRGVALEMLNRVFAPDTRRPMMWALVADERRVLEALDVPRYVLSVREHVLTAAAGETVSGHLVLSGLDAARRGLDQMSEADLERQLDLLRSALEVTDSSASVSAPETAGAGLDPAAVWIRGAERLGARILARGRRGEDGALTWTDSGGAGPHGRLDLYRGQAGIALFLAALAAVTGKERFSEAAAAALRPLENVLPGWPSIGACSGAGSVVYALAAAGRLTGDVRWMEAALRWAEEISPARIASDSHLDVAGGAAGALLALLALDDAGRPWIAARVADCTRRLLETQVATGADSAAWPGPDGRARAGFAHGAAGIAYALGRAWTSTGDAALEAAVRRAHRHERRLFSPAAQNWPAAHDGGTIAMTAWCHGAPGIGLARALGPETFRDAEILEEIHVAMTTTTVAPPSRTDHLCCGDMGRSEALLVMGMRLDDREASAAAETLATRVAARACADGGRGIRTEGFEHRTFHPGFFRGLAGIGYQLLRTAAPRRLPSVLGFETIAGAR